MAVKETTVSVAWMHFIFAEKYLDNRDSRSQNTCLNSDKLGFLFSFSQGEVMQYFCLLKSYALFLLQK